MSTNFFLPELAEKLKLQTFRGVFMRDELKTLIPLDTGILGRAEFGIFNFDPSTKGGSHWVAWYLDRKDWFYFFGSYGTAVPKELREYFAKRHG